MIKNLRFYLFLASLLMFSALGAYAQNCTVNAGAPRTICPGSPFVLVGTATGAFAETAVWTQIEGPAVTVGSSSEDPLIPGNIRATITGYASNATYKFRLSAKCTDGSPISNDVVYTVSNLTVAAVGADRVECPGTITLVGNTLKLGETGTWSRAGSSTLSFTQANGVATVILPNNSANTATFTYTITDGTCTTSDQVVVRNLGGVPTVNAGTDITLGCYTVTTNRVMNASFGGSGNGQIGTWSFISGPSTPNFSNPNSNTANVTNLKEGTYVLRWTVAGACVNGTDDVTITVLPASQSVTQVNGQTLTYCDGRNSTILTGTKPLYSGETVLWELTSGQTGVNITNPTSFTTSIGGLVNGQNYDFKYTITNTNTNCTSVGTYSIRYTAPPSITLNLTSPQILACNTDELSIQFTTGGGNLTQWAMISAPTGYSGSIGVYANVTGGNSQAISNLDKIGTYVVRFKTSSDNSSGGCVDAFADMTILVSQTPYTATAGTAQLLACGTLTATLAGNPPLGNDVGVGSWTQVEGPNTAVIADRFNSNTGISGLTSGVYTFRWIVSGGSGNCGNTQADVDVVVASMPTIVSAGTKIDACFGTPIKLDGSIPALNETGTWTVVSALPAGTITFSNPKDPKATATGFQADGIYKLRWTISNNCGTISDDVEINTSNSNGPKQAIAGANQCFGPTTTSFSLSGNAAGTGETGTWTLLPGSPAGATFTAGNATTAVNIINTGTYTFEWKIERGACTPTRDTVAITIAPPTTIAVITGAPLQNICATSPTTSYVLNLTANQPTASETGTWTQVEGPGGAVINNPNSYNTANVTGLIDARYKFRWTISNNSCASSFAEITYNIGEGPSVAVAGSDQSVCDLTSTTLAAVAPTVGTGIWSVVSGPNSPTFANVTSPTSTISNLVLGVYTLKWTTTNGPFCASSTANMVITVKKSANAGADQNLCNVTTTSLIGNEGSKGTWSLVSKPAAAANPTITPNIPANNSAIVTGLGDGEYKFKYTITSGGCGILTDDVNVVISGPPSIADAGADQEICTATANSVNLTAVEPTTGTGVWSFLSRPTNGVAIITTPSAFQTTVTGLTVPGVYLLEYTISNANCSGSQSNKDVVRITVYAPPTTVLAMAPQTNACQNGVILTGTTPTVGVGTWTYVSGGTSVPVITSPNSPTTTITGLAVALGNPYIFRWTIANGACASSSQTVSVTVTDVSPGPAQAGADASVCTSGGTASYTLNATTAVGGTGTWTITGPGSPTFVSATNPTTTVSNLVRGTYTLKWTVTNNSSCKTEDTMVITVFDPPTTADAGPNTASYCLYSPVQLAATPTTSGIGTWTTVAKPAGSLEPVFSNVNAANATVGGLGSGNYTFRWTTSNGPCTTSQDDIVVTIEDCQIAIAKAAGTPVQQADGTFNVTFTFKVKNTGTTPLNNVQVQDQLNLTFPSPKVFSVAANAVSTNNAVLTPNPAFNGVGDQNLLVAASSTLAPNQEVIITLIVNVTL